MSSFLNNFNKKNVFGVTLAELIIATVLIGLVLLTAASLDVASRRFYSRAEQGAVALNDISAAIEYMERDFQRTIGDVNAPGFTAFNCGGSYSAGFQLLIDFDEDGIAEPPPAGDIYFTYCYSDANNVIDYTNNIETMTISRRVVDFSYSPPVPIGNVVVTLKARDDPDSGPDPDNPDVTLQTGAYFRSSSLK